MSLNEKSKKQFLERKRDKNKIGNYIIGKTLEENLFIKLRKGKNLITNENVIIKIIDKSYFYESESNLNNLTSEINILKIMHHKNIVRLYELREMATNLYLISEYCENNSLFEYVKNYSNKGIFNYENQNNQKDKTKSDNYNSINYSSNEKPRNVKTEPNLDKESPNFKSESGDLVKLNSKRNLSDFAKTINDYSLSNYDSNNRAANLNASGNYSNNLASTSNLHGQPGSFIANGLPELEACRLFQDLIDGLEYLHSQNICIRDINPHNLFLDYKKNLKIANFSFSKIYQNDKLLTTPIGMLQFTAPEMLLGKGYHGLFSDIWSCGVTLYFMLTGTFPFYDQLDEVSLKKINENKIDFPSCVSALARDMIVNMLNKDCLHRFDLNQIKSHPWFNLSRPNLNNGININFVSIPVDEKIVFKLENLEFDGETLRNKIRDNIHDESTAVYYLFLKNQIKGGYKSIADLESQLFVDYITNPANFIKNIEFIRKEKELLNEETEYLKNNYVYCGNTNENNFRKLSNEDIEEERNPCKKRNSLLIEEEFDMPNADKVDNLNLEVEECKFEESKSNNKKFGLKPSKSLSKETPSKPLKKVFMRSLTCRIDKNQKCNNISSNDFNLEFENESELKSLDLEYDEVNQDKDKEDIDYQKGLLYNIEEIGNDFDQPDDDLINLMNSTNKRKNDKKEKSLGTMRKSSIFTKYTAEPIKEESFIDYVRPKKNSYLNFLERNDVYGKVSYNKKERESLFKDIAFDNQSHLTDSKDPKSFIERFKSIGKSANSTGKSQADKENKAEVISKANKNMLFNFFKMKIQEIINEDEDHDSSKLEEKIHDKKKKKFNKNLKEKSPKKDKNRYRDNNKHNPKDLKLEIKNKEKELLNNKKQLLKSSNIRERVREYSKETIKKRSILNKLNNGEVEAIVENLYNYSSDESKSNYSSSEEKPKKEFKVFKPRKIIKEQDPKEKQKELKNKAKEFAKKVKISEEQKIKVKSDKRDFTMSPFENGFGADKYDLKKISKYSHSDKNKDFIKLLEKYFNMENGPINMQRIEGILKDLNEQNRITNFAEFYKEIKDINKKIKVIKVINNDNVNDELQLNTMTEPNEEQRNINKNKNTIKVKQIRTSSLPKNTNSVYNYDYLLKDLNHQSVKTTKHMSLIPNEKDYATNKNSIKLKKKVSDNGNCYQKTSVSVEKTDAHEEEDDTGVFIDENFIGKLKENIKKTLKETDQILMESRKIKKEVNKPNQINSNIKQRSESTIIPNSELKNFSSIKKIDLKRHKFNSLEKIDLAKTFKYMNLMTESCDTERANKLKRGLSIDLIGDKVINRCSNTTNGKLMKSSNKEEIKFRKLLEEENISPVNTPRDIICFNNLNKEQNKDNLCFTNQLKNHNLNDSLISKPIIKIIKVNNLENVNEPSIVVNKDLKYKPNECVNKGNKAGFNNFERKNKSINLNNIEQRVSLLNKITEKINENKAAAQKNNLMIKRDSNSINLDNNSDTLSNILKTESNEIFNYKNLLENLGVYSNKDKMNKKDKKDQPIVNNTNISITIKKKNYYFDNKTDPKRKSILKKIEVVKEEPVKQTRINNEGKHSESTLDSFNYQEILNLKQNNNQQIDRNNSNLYTNKINNKRREDNNESNKEHKIHLTEVSNAEICKTTNEIFRADSFNLTESMDSGFSYIKNVQSKDSNEIKDKQTLQNKPLNKNEINQKDSRRVMLNKNTTANLICNSKIEDKNTGNLNPKTQESNKKLTVSVKNSKNENKLKGIENAKIIKVEKQNVHTLIMNYLAESKTCFLYKNEKFKVTKTNLNYDIELTKIISNQNEIKPLNSSANSYYVKFLFVKGNKNGFIEEITKIQSLLME